MTTEPRRPRTAEAVLTQGLGWLDGGHGAALVTVLRTWSSASARPGSLLAVNRAGDWFGDVSGGVLQAEIIATAVDAIAHGKPRELRLQVDDSAAQCAGLPCGGALDLRVEPLSEATDVAPDQPPAASATSLSGLLRQVLASIGERRAVVLCTRLSDARRLLLSTGDATPGDTALMVAASRAAAVDATGVVDVDGEPVFLQVFNPPRRLFVVGAVHIAQALVAAASLLGFDVTVIDPRPGYATAERFPGSACVVERPELALRMAALDARSAVVTLSHDPAVDDPALVKALHSRAFYVGALGSRKTHKARLKRLQDDFRLSERLTAKLHAPAGLAIGAVGPAEIAASIVAQLIGALRGRMPATAASPESAPDFDAHRHRADHPEPTSASSSTSPHVGGAAPTP